MALVTISGLPCSGKSYRATQFKQFFEDKITDPSYSGPLAKVVIISDHNLNVQRSAYNDSRSEKIARGVLFAALQRELGPDKIVILDAPNYIKGFRYQLHCAAREMRIRTTTLFVAATPEACRAKNTSLGNLYPPETLDALCLRYEEPSSMARWDSPLFTVLWEEETVPGGLTWEAITEGVVKLPNSGTIATAKSPTNALQVLEQATSQVVSSIMISREANPCLGGTFVLIFDDGLKGTIILPHRSVSISELQRYKRQFVVIHKMAVTLGTTEKGSVDWGAHTTREKFISYIEQNIK